MMNCCKHAHRVYDVTVTDTNVILSVFNSTNIGENERFVFYLPKPIRRIINASITAGSLPVLINVNGENVQLINVNNKAVESSNIPRRSDGIYITPVTGEPFVKLFCYRNKRRCGGALWTK